jgi:glycosyltransferase involved in cell wall biosynthesis
MIIKSAAWNYEAFYESKHPEYVAIRNLVNEHPEHDFILIGHGEHFEHFRLGRVLFYNLGSGNKFKFLFSLACNFLLPLFLRSSVIVGMGGINEIPIAMASILTRAKFIPTIVIDIWYSVSEMPAQLKRGINLLLRASFRASYVNLAISKSIKKELVENYHVDPQKVLIYNYKISDIFNSHVSSELKKTLNPHGPVVLTICRISPQKGLQYLVEASKIVSEKIPNVTFVLRAYASEIAYKKKLLELIDNGKMKNHFKIIEEYSSYEDIPKYMAASDVFVLPSISEGLGIVLLEAMACGVPVIGSKIGGISDIIFDGYNGLLVEPKDIQSLANAIMRVLSDNTLKIALSRGALTTTKCVKQNELQLLLSKSIFS